VSVREGVQPGCESRSLYSGPPPESEQAPLTRHPCYIVSLYGREGVTTRCQRQGVSKYPPCGRRRHHDRRRRVEPASPALHRLLALALAPLGPPLRLFRACRLLLERRRCCCHHHRPLQSPPPSPCPSSSCAAVASASIWSLSPGKSSSRCFFCSRSVAAGSASTWSYSSRMLLSRRFRCCSRSCRISIRIAPC